MSDYAWEGKGLDEHAAKELFLWIENDGDMYRQQYTPIIKNLVAKKARGVYRSDLAAKLFGYLAENGAKKYYREMEQGLPTEYTFVRNVSPEWSRMFPKKLRDAVAEELRDRFEAEYELGNYVSYIPKKYQNKPIKRKTKSKKSTPQSSVRGLR